jgi:hypothetical protein
MYKTMEKSMYSFIGCVGLVLANSILFFAPQILLLGLTALQGGMIINEFIESKWQKIFINLGLYNAEKKTPSLIKKDKNDLGDRYIFSIPAGLCLSDFQKVKEELETVICKSLDLSLTNNFKLVIQIFDIEYKSVYKPKKEVYLNE